MKKFFPALVMLFLLGACSFNLPFAVTPPAVIATTVAPPLPTSSPLPSPTPVLANPSDTPPPGQTLPSETATLVPSNFTATSVPPDLTATFVTATELPLNTNPSATPTLPGVPGLPTASPTLGIRLYGTLPPQVPFNEIAVWNKSGTEAYISLQVTLNDGRYSILEYPVKNRVKIKAPLGSYVYVAWVGGAKMSGGFRLSSETGLTIYLYRDKVVIR